MTSSLPHEAVPMDYDPYLGLVRHVLAFGDTVPDRTGTGTLEVFGCTMAYNLAQGFPLTTLKKTNFRAIVVELLWLLRGEPHLDFMHKYGVKHWDPWIPADERFGPGDLGRVYGVQWRNWTALEPVNPEHPSHPREFRTTDQIAELLKGLRENPHGRRHIVTCWNPGELDQMALPPCHMTFQMHVSSKGVLSCQVYQRSADMFIGVPYDVGMYALLVHMIADVLGLEVGMLIFNFGSAHIYLNHVELATEMIQRERRDWPTLNINYPKGVLMDLDSFDLDQFTLLDYDPHPFMKAPVAV